MEKKIGVLRLSAARAALGVVRVCGRYMAPMVESTMCCAHLSTGQLSAGMEYDMRIVEQACCSVIAITEHCATS